MDCPARGGEEKLINGSRKNYPRKGGKVGGVIVQFQIVGQGSGKKGREGLHPVVCFRRRGTIKSVLRFLGGREEDRGEVFVYRSIGIGGKRKSEGRSGAGKTDQGKAQEVVLLVPRGSKLREQGVKKKRETS